MQSEEQEVSQAATPVVPSFVPDHIASVGFGVELETSVPDYGETESNITCHFDDVGLELPDVHGDGSIDAEDYGYCGLEVATPILKFSNGGKEYIEELCRVLRDEGATVNRSCGMHVHIGAENLSTDAIRYLWAIYIAYEDVFESFVPHSRRNNQYCGSFRSHFSIEKVLKARDKATLERMWYDVVNNSQANARKLRKHDNSRYHFLNLHSYFSQGHYEIRSHSGTVNAKKVLEWVRLHLFVRARAVQLATVWGSNDFLIANCNSSDLQRKTERLFNAIELPEDARAYFLQRQSMFMRPVPQVAQTEEIEEEEGEGPVNNQVPQFVGVTLSSCVA